eukprot:2038475-Prymnesium_polylepis.1
MHARTLSSWQHAMYLSYIVGFSGVVVLSGLTFYFVNICIELTRAIREFKLWPPEGSKLIAVADAGNDGSDDADSSQLSDLFVNYELMKSSVEDFTRSFSLFFFVAEFVLVPVSIISPFAIHSEVKAFQDAVDAKERDVAAARVVVMAAFATIVLIIAWSLLSATASLTGAVHRVRDRAHALCMQLAAQLGNASTMLAEAQTFYELVEAEVPRLGFHFQGILISP